MQVYISNRDNEFLKKGMKERGETKKSEYVAFLIKNDLKKLGILKIDDLIGG